MQLLFPALQQLSPLHIPPNCIADGCRHAGNPLNATLIPYALSQHHDNSFTRTFPSQGCFRPCSKVVHEKLFSMSVPIISLSSVHVSACLAICCRIDHCKHLL